MWNLTTAQQWKKTAFVWLCSVLIGLIIQMLILIAFLDSLFIEQCRSFMLYTLNHTIIFSIPAAFIFLLMIKYILVDIMPVSVRNFYLHFFSWILVFFTYLLFLIVCHELPSYKDVAFIIFSGIIVLLYCFSVSISILIASQSAKAPDKFTQNENT